MKIKKLPIDPGPAGWNAILPHRGPTNAMEGKKTCLLYTSPSPRD